MESKRYVIMGGGEVGRYLARTLSSEGHRVTVIDRDPAKRQLVEEQLDARFVQGNGAHVPTLEAAGVVDCDLLVATSSSDEANLAASLLAIFQPQFWRR
jgi:trk system potassium uptake protein TrkA